MPHNLFMAEDGILRINFNGLLDLSGIDTFRKDLEPFLTAATETQPIHMINDSSEVRNITSSARKKFIELNQDLRFGNIAIIKPARPARILAGIMAKAAGRDNLSIFESEDEGISWLKLQKNGSKPSDDLES